MDSQDEAAKKEPEFRKGFRLEGKYGSPKVFSLIEGAKDIKLAPAYEWKYGVKLFTKEEWEKLDAEWNAYVANATRIANGIVEKLKVEWVRSERGVIDYAILQNEDPFFSSIIISKKFHPLFKEKLGENLHVIIPDRETIYVFPAEGGKLNGYGPSIVTRYETSNQSVSTEVILLNSKGYKVIGELGK